MKRFLLGGLVLALLAGGALYAWLAFQRALAAPLAFGAEGEARLFEVISNALQDKATTEKLLIQGIVPRPMSLAELRSFVRSENEKFGRVAEAAEIRAE